MKNKLKIITILLFLAAIFAIACNKNETANESSATNTAGEKQTYRSKGVIKRIDAETNKLTIDHEDIPGYMSAMEMSAPVADKKLIEASKVGDKIEFEIERTGSNVVITMIKKIGEDELAKSFLIYKTNCAKCHGEKGDGVEDKGISFLKGHALGHPEADFIRRVTNGKGDEMPSFKDKLSEKEIADVVKYVRDEIQSKADPKDKGEGHDH